MKYTKINGWGDYVRAVEYEAASKAAPREKRNVVWARQLRRYRRLCRLLDRRQADKRWGGDVEVPHRLSAWGPTTSAALLSAYPDVSHVVAEIEALRAQRAAMREDPAYLPQSTYQRRPLPNALEAPGEWRAERTRRAVATMRLLRQRRKAERAELANLDLVQGAKNCH